LRDLTQSTTARQLAQNNLTGIVWALIATVLFTVAATLAKISVNEYHVLQILFFRQIVVFLSTLPSIVATFPESLKTNYPLLHAIRLIGAFIALSCSIWAVAVLPLTTAITLGFVQAFFVTLLAALVLKEHIGVHRITVLIMGFAGVLIIMRPGVAGLVDLYTLIPVLGAAGAAIAIIAVRKLSQTDSTATLLVYQSVFVGALAAIPLFWLWVTPDRTGLVLLLAIGVVSATGQWVGVKALRLGEASVIANINYTSLFFSAVLGYLVFSELPDKYTLIGAMLIIGSSVYLFQRESISKKQST